MIALVLAAALAGVAQVAEHGSHAPVVAGSTPAAGPFGFQWGREFCTFDPAEELVGCTRDAHTFRYLARWDGGRVCFVDMRMTFPCRKIRVACEGFRRPRLYRHCPEL